MTPHAEKVSMFTRQISDKKLCNNKCFFAQNKCKSANMGSSTVQLHGVDLIDIQIQNLL